jgi:hypothetical protein
MVEKTTNNEFEKYICNQFDILPIENGKFFIFTPFHHADGDSYKIILKRIGDKWYLTDEANTLMKLSYNQDLKNLKKGNRKDIIKDTLEMLNVSQKDGELFIQLKNKADLGKKLFKFIQAIGRMMDVEYLSRERVRSTFFEDFKESIRKYFPKNNYEFKWHDNKHDQKGDFTIDCFLKVNDVQVFIFALNTNTSVRDATIAILQHKEWENKFKSIGVFENMEQISKNVLSRFTYSVDTMYPSLYSNSGKFKEKIENLTTLPN